MNKLLRITFSVSLVLTTLFSAQAQVVVTYGGLNSPELSALAGSEYLAKIDNNILFTGSSTQNSITLLSFDENTPNNPFTLVQNWIGSVDGFTLGSVKDLHFDSSSQLLYVVQQNPSALVVLSFDENTNSLSFNSETSLTGMLTPERFAITDDLIMVVDMVDGKAADLTYDGANAPVLVSIHDLTSCGVLGTYKDVEVAPNGAFMYVTCFSPANLIKFSLSPSGMTCEGIIDLNALVGSSLAGDLTFISEDRALVTSCIGSSGVVRMDENGDMVDPVIGSLGLFDAMKSVYLPADSLFMIQSAGSNGGTFKLNSDYSMTQLSAVSSMTNYNNELIEMADNALVRSENAEGFLGLLVKEDGLYHEVSRTYQGGTVLTPGTMAMNTIELNDAQDALYLSTDDGIQTLQIEPDGSLSAGIFFETTPWFSNVQSAYIDDTHMLIFNSWDQSVRSVSLDFTTGEVSLISEQTHPDLYYDNEWQLINDRVGKTVVIVPPTGSEVYTLSIDENYSLSQIDAIELPAEISIQTGLEAELSPSSSSLVIVSQHQCSERLIRMQRIGQNWSIVQNDLMSSIGSAQCPVTDLSFMGNEEELVMLTTNGVFMLDVTEAGIVTDFDYFSPDFTFSETQKIMYNPMNDVFILATSELSGEGQEVRVFDFDMNQATPMSNEQLFEISNGTSVHGFERINGLIQLSDGSAFYASDHVSGLVHVFGVQDETLVSTITTEEFGFGVYPNPTNNSFSIQFSEQFSGSIELIDNVGRVISSKSVTGNSLVNFNANDVPTGMYHIRCIDQNGTIQSQRLVKQD